MIIPVTNQKTLSNKEIQILASIANGKKNKETALELKNVYPEINEQCIKNNMFKIYKKLNAVNNVDCVVKSLEMGILTWIYNNKNKEN